MNAVGGESTLRRALRLTGSTWIGVILIAWILLYLAVVSVWESADPAGLRRLLGIQLTWRDQTAAGVYSHWLLVAPGVGLCVNLLAATLTRVRLSLPNAGAWSCHLGVLVLAAGATWYVLARQSGRAFAVRTETGFSEINCFYLTDSEAVYATVGDGEPVQTRLPRLRPHSRQGLDKTILGGPQGVRIRATEFLPHAHIESVWRNDSPNETPAVCIEVVCDRETTRLVLASRPGLDKFAGGDYTIAYAAEMTQDGIDRAMGAGAWPGPGDVALIVTGAKIEPTLLVLRAGQPPHREALAAGRAVKTLLCGRKIVIRAVEFLSHAALHTAAEPADAQDPSAAGALRVELSAGRWETTEFLAFTGPVGDSRAHRVDLPGGKVAHLLFAAARVPLPATVEIRRARRETYPASVVPKDYVCDVDVRAGGLLRRDRLALNNPIRVGEYRISHDRWEFAGDEPVVIFVAAASRPGIALIWLGMGLIAAGLPYAFYVRPLLLRRKGRPS